MGLLLIWDFSLRKSGDLICAGVTSFVFNNNNYNAEKFRFNRFLGLDSATNSLYDIPLLILIFSLPWLTPLCYPTRANGDIEEIMRFSLERNADAYIKTTGGVRTPSTWRNNTTDSRRIEHLHEWKIEKQQMRGSSDMS